MPCQDVPSYTSPECLAVSSQQTLRPSSGRLLCLTFSRLWEERVPTPHLLQPAVLSSTKAPSTGADRHSDKSDQTTAPTKPLRSSLSYRKLLCLFCASFQAHLYYNTHQKGLGESVQPGILSSFPCILAHHRAGSFSFLCHHLRSCSGKHR